MIYPEVSDISTNVMHDGALVHYLIDERYDNDRFYRLATSSSQKLSSFFSAVYES